MTDEDYWDAAQDGAELIVEGHVADAQRVLETLTESQPENPYAHSFLGNALFEQKAYVKALRAYLTALELAPQYVGVMVSTGHTLRLLGRYGEAIRMGKQVLMRDKQDADALFLLGSCHFARGDNEAAIGYLEGFLLTNPELEAGTEAHGMLKVIRGEVLQAVAEQDDVN